MKKKILILMLAACCMTIGFSSVSTFAAEETVSEEAQVVETLAVTEVKEWGETLTAIRIEYSEEIDCGAVRHDNWFQTYNTTDARSIRRVYVNNTGKPHDVEAFGKYVFIEYDDINENGVTYHNNTTFNEASQNRERLDQIRVCQNHDIITKSGKVVKASSAGLREGGFFHGTSGEIRVGIDDFKYAAYDVTEEGTERYYMLYVPEGYEEKKEDLENLPLIVHFPSTDYTCTDFNGEYTGALYRHPDCIVWASDEVQEDQPCFVITIGASGRLGNFDVEDKDSVQQFYKGLVDMMIENYNVDTSRIYSMSIGGGGTSIYAVAQAYPDMFAAIMSAGFEVYYAEEGVKDYEGDINTTIAEDKMASMMEAHPCWFFAGLYDPTGSDPMGEGRRLGERLRDLGYIMEERGELIDVAYGEAGELMWDGMADAVKAKTEAETQLARAAEAGATSFVTLYMPNTIITNQHWSWSPAYTNPGVQEWLFAQTNDQPYDPAI